MCVCVCVSGVTIRLYVCDWKSCFLSHVTDGGTGELESFVYDQSEQELRRSD